MNSETIQSPGKQEIEKFTELIKDIRVAMFTTVAPDGSLRSRPMMTLDTDFDGDLWFFTDDDSPKADEVTAEHHVCVAYAEPEKQRYVSVSGLATVLHDKERAKELWTPAAKAFFPRGVEDPHLGILRVRTVRVEYWDSPSGKMVQLFGLAKAVFTGKRPDTLGEHKTLDVMPPSESV